MTLDHMISSSCLDGTGFRKKGLSKKPLLFIVYKALNNHAPSNLTKIFNERETNYDLRDKEKVLAIPKPCTNFMKRLIFKAIVGRYFGANSQKSRDQPEH